MVTGTGLVRQTCGSNRVHSVFITQRPLHSMVEKLAGEDCLAQKILFDVGSQGSQDVAGKSDSFTTSAPPQTRPASPSTQQTKMVGMDLRPCLSIVLQGSQKFRKCCTLSLFSQKALVLESPCSLIPALLSSFETVSSSTQKFRCS